MIDKKETCSRGDSLPRFRMFLFRPLSLLRFPLSPNVTLWLLLALGAFTFLTDFNVFLWSFLSPPSLYRHTCFVLCLVLGLQGRIIGIPEPHLLSVIFICVGWLKGVTENLYPLHGCRQDGFEPSLTALTDLPKTLTTLPTTSS